jgi:hypothetical protein
MPASSHMTRTSSEGVQAAGRPVIVNEVALEVPVMSVPTLSMHTFPVPAALAMIL